MGRKTSVFGSIALFAAIATGEASAQAHYVPGVMFIRDYSAPAPGVYAGAYNYFYSTDRLNDADGNKIRSITIAGRVYDIRVDVDAYALAPFLIWSTDTKVLGAQFAAMIAPTFSNTNINGLVENALGAGRSVSAGQFNVGDMQVLPVWLTWSGKRYSVTYDFSFYAPIGKYETRTITLPNLGPVAIASPDNVGLGFWTYQNQGAFYLYPWTDQRVAILNALTWEINGHKRNFDLTPGQYLTWNWGVGLFLPLKKDKSLLLEVGPVGYGSFQVTDDTGVRVRNPGRHDHVYAAGLQAGVTSVERVMSLNFHWMQEFDAADRFQGAVLGFDFVFKF